MVADISGADNGSFFAILGAHILGTFCTTSILPKTEWMVQNILNYWYQLELFTPSCPFASNRNKNLLETTLPWESSQDDPKIQKSYEVYFGKARANALFKHMISCLGLQQDEQTEKDKTPTCICALKVDREGKYVANSFTLSTFAWAVGLIASTPTSDAKLDISELEALEGSLDMRIQAMQEVGAGLSASALSQIYSMACAAAKMDCAFFGDIVWAHEKRQHANKEGKFPPIEPSTELMHSFYLKDMAAIRDNPTDTVTQYVLAMEEKNHDRICIDQETAQMQRWVQADAFPRGVWPSAYNPCLMQQLSINLAISNEQAVFSVNGPPGTGKTTLLKEIVASNIVERAIKMMAWDSPDSAFTKVDLSDPANKYSTHFYKMDPSLSEYGILVASNNNAAVENISVELPKAIKCDRSNCFSSAKGTAQEEIYFTNVAERLLGEPAWGLISARLGKKTNINELKERLWWAEDKVTLKSHFSSKDRPDWETARQNFKEALQAVQEARKEIENAQNLLQQEKQVQKALEMAQTDCREQAQATIQAKKEQQDARQSVNALMQQLEVQEQNVETLRRRIPFFKRTLYWWFLDDPVVKEWKSAKALADELVVQLTRSRTKCRDCESALSQRMAQYQTAEQNVVQEKNTLGQLQSRMADIRRQFGPNWADDTFWADITQNEQSQSSCPWTNEHYDKLREELFFQALVLHKAFILSSRSVKNNLGRLLDLWSGKLSYRDRQLSYGSLFNTLLLVIPVISTTFASVQTFLDGIQEKEIGLLIVDEAGQATPHSALGALWRAKKAVIVGDPMQVEPIVTVPREICAYFAKKNSVPEAYRDTSLSVQALADQMNRYGGIRQYEGNCIWVGSPLILHRRCIGPMFNISNQVAYNGKMFLKTKAPGENQRFLMNTSVWLDCKGREEGNGNHTVRNQITLVSELVKRAIAVYQGLPNLYVITPFNTVADSLRKELYATIGGRLPSLSGTAIDDWLQESCGTIHTFQGKEAQEVLLVLGCDSTSGSGAARWVGQRPNIINVAVSRAKYRIGIVGDYALWKDIPYVQTACEYLEPTDAESYLQI